MRKIFVVISVILLVLLSVATFFDLGIAKTVFMKDNTFSYVCEHLAPVVLATIITIAVSLLVFTYEKGNTKKSHMILSGIVYLLMNGFSVLLCITYIGKIGLVYIGIIIILSGLLVSKLPKESGKQARRVGAAMLLTIFVSMILVETTKPIVGRVRFRSMQENFDLFTRWYQVNGDNNLAMMPAKEEIKSFPSGHSQWAGCTLVLSFLASLIPSWGKHEKKIFFIALGYAGIIMLSRMMQGAHFLSDVTVGFSTSFILFIIFRKLLVQRKEKSFIN